MQQYAHAFNDDILLQNLFAQKVNEHNPDILIETGTLKGITTEYLASFNKPVMTFEINENYYNESKEKLSGLSNVQMYHGDSATVMEKEFDKLQDKLVFAFLDAHWENDFCVERELTLFKKLNIKPIIMIHDFYVPGKDFGYDEYSGQRYDYEYFKPYFINLYGEKGYTYLYNTEAVGCCRGVIIVEPVVAK